MKKSQLIYNRVVELLKQNPKYRDSDTALCVRMWYDIIQQDTTMTAIDFLNLYRNDKITTEQTITRLRRKAQELNPDLRGASYKTRQTHKFKKAKQEIREIREPKNINVL